MESPSVSVRDDNGPMGDHEQQGSVSDTEAVSVVVNNNTNGHQNNEQKKKTASLELRTTGRVDHETYNRLQPTESNKGWLVLINPKSGAGNGLRTFQRRVQPRLFDSWVPCVVLLTERANHARDLVREANLNQFHGIVIVSGDGLIHEVMNGLASRSDLLRALDTPIIMIPGGSGNAFAFSMAHAAGLTTQSSSVCLRAAVDSLVSGLDVPVQLMRVETEHSNYVSFLGISYAFLSDVDIETEKYRRLLGSQRFVYGVAMRLVNPPTYKARISFVRVQDVSANSSTSIAVEGSKKKLSDYDLIQMPASIHDPVPEDWESIELSIVQFYACILSHISHDAHYSPDSTLADDTIYMSIVPPVNRTKLAKFMLRLGEGTHTQLPFVQTIPVRAFRFEPIGPPFSYLTVDGELMECVPMQACISRLRSCSRVCTHAAKSAQVPRHETNEKRLLSGNAADTAVVRM